MLATPSGGEFNRFDRDGDYVEGNIQIIEISDPKGAFLEFLSAEYGVLAGGLRQNGNDLEFYDTTHGVWMKLSTLTGHLGDIYYVSPAAGQTVFPLPFNYVVGSDTLNVYLISTGKIPGPGAPTPVYVETSTGVVTFNAAVVPWTPFIGGGTELLCFHVGGRPIVNDTYLVKGDAADANPQALDVKITGSGAVVATSPGSPADTLRDLNVPFAVAAPPASAGAGAIGVSANVARQDHQHPSPAQDPPLGGAVPIVEGVGASGVSGSCSRQDHVHPTGPANPPLAGGIPPADGGSGAVGASGNAARQDHQHPGNYYYDEATNGAGFTAGAGPNHIITVGTAYPTGVNALMPFHNGVMLPLSRITELTALTYQINGLGPLGATDIVVTRLAG